MNAKRIMKNLGVAAAVVSAVGLAVTACGEDTEEAASTRPAELETNVQRSVESVSGNPTCSEFGEHWVEYRLDSSEIHDGEFTTPDGYVTIDIQNYNGKTFDWTATEGLDAVFVKGGPGGLLYRYTPEARSDEGLTAMRDGKSYGVSHVSFCYDAEFARISIDGSDVNEVGESHTFDVNVEQKIGFDGEWEPVDDETIVEVSLIPSRATMGVSTLSDTCASGTSAGSCFVTFTSDAAGIVTGRAVADIMVDNAALHVETDGEGENSGAAVKRFVDAWITIASDAVNEVGAPHTFTVTGMMDDGNSSSPVPAGTPIGITLDNAHGALATDIVDGCGSGADSSGQCTIQFVSNSAGSVTASASMTVNVGGLSLQRSTTGSGQNSAPAVKRFVDAWITITPDDTNDVRDYHTFTVSALMNDGQGTIGPVLPGTTIAVTLTNSNGAQATDITDGCATGTDGSGSCTVSFRSDSAGTIIGHAAMTANVGGVDLFRETNGQGLNSAAATKTYVDASISIGPSGTNGIGEEHTFTVSATQNDGQGNAGPVPNGTSVTVTLTPMAGAELQLVSDGCATGTSNGSCDVTFVSDTAGTIAGHAAMKITVSGLEISRETDGLHANSDDATKEYVAGALTWVKLDAGTSAPLGGATFEVCRTADYVTATTSFQDLSSPVCVSVVDYVGDAPAAEGDQDGRPGMFQLTGLALGRYTITETAAPDGYTADTTPKTVELSIGNTTGQPTSGFVNRQVRPSGCTPGFWKNHTELWDRPNDPVALAAGFRTRDSFNEVFGLSEDQSPFGDRASMEDAINAGGGGAEKLARHAVAALLNWASGHPYVYGSSAEALKTEITNAFIDGNYEPLATELDSANNVGCLVD